MSRLDLGSTWGSAWQRRAAAELTAILDAHRDLPRITWTVGHAGAVLSGRVPALGRRAADARAAFAAWQTTLGLDSIRLGLAEHGVDHLCAVGDRNGVSVGIVATILDELDGEGR